MKFLITGDWHIDTTFGSRKDDVFETVCDKINQILRIAKREGCEAILQPGDFFDSHRANDFMKQHFISVFKTKKIPIYTVYGQHDLRYHSSNVFNTPLKVMEASEVVMIMKHRPLIYPEKMIQIFGSSWFQNMPDVEEFGKVDGVKILILHKMIVDEKIWKGQEDYAYSNIFLKKNTQFDLIVSGDNHATFTAQSGKRFLINAGSLLRTRIDQEDHKPCAFIYDTDEPEIQRIDLTVQDFNKVIKIEEAKKKKRDDENLKKMIKMVASNNQLAGINYRKNIKKYLDEHGSEFFPRTRKFIDEVLDSIGE